MDAGVRRVMGLISEMNVRYVVPVYQRPYSWGEEQCLQLWDDILACGRSREQTHFTGSIVTMQDGTASPQGVAALAVIDGQPRSENRTRLITMTNIKKLVPHLGCSQMNSLAFSGVSSRPFS